MKRSAGLMLLASGTLVALTAAGPARAQVRRFDLPAQNAATAVVQFGRQAQVQLLAPWSVVQGLRTRAVRGEFEVHQALARMLDGTGLEVASDNGQVIVLRRSPTPTPTPAPAPVRTARPSVVPASPVPRPRAPGPLVAAVPTNLTLDEVLVSASRIRSLGFTAPTPTVTLGREELMQRSPNNLIESINDMPQFRAIATPQTSSGATTGTNANAGVAVLDLRALGTARTLLLINGRRAGASNDLAQVPLILTRRTEVVTGGGSAAYGSDAVAGVVNIVLNTDFTGLRMELQGGGSRYGDGENRRGGVAYGREIQAGRGHALVAAEYIHQGAMTSAPDRPWLHEGRYVQIANGASAANGLPPFINTREEYFSTVAPGGLITSGPLKGITFEDGGAPRLFRYGTVIGNYMLGGENPNPFTYNIQPRIDRYAALGRLDLELSPRLKAWTEADLSGVRNQTLNPRSIDQGNLTIKAENPFIPAPVRAEMGRLGLASLTMGRINLDGGQPTTVNDNIRHRFAVGAEGALGGTWRWDAFAQYSLADTWVKTRGSRNTARWLQALDAVAGPNGSVLCRNPANGCVPFNIFGPNAASQAARDFVFGVQTSKTRRRQTNLAFNLHGEPFRTWAGPASVAAGLEYRRETQDTVGDPIAQAQGWDSGNVTRLKGAYEVKEAYVEAAAPLLKDAVLARELTLNAALRVADYSTAGGAAAWKLGATWEPTPSLLLRATRSRDVRAPNINELYAAGTNTLQNAINVRGPNAGLGVIVPLYTSGNPDLKMERANTWTAGAVWRPMAGRLEVSADYYSVTILNQIGSIGWNAITTRCASGRQDFCDLISFDAVGNILAVNNPTINNNRFVARGVDFEARFEQPLDELQSWLRGVVTARVFASRAIEFSVDDGVAGKIDRVGTLQPTLIGTASVPRWGASYFVGYAVGGFSGTVQFKYVAPGVLESTSITGTSTERLNNKVSSQTTVNVSARYNLTARGRPVQIYGSVNNLFNRGPPFPVYPLSQLGVFYDAVGMTYRAGVRLAF